MRHGDIETAKADRAQLGYALRKGARLEWRSFHNCHLFHIRAANDRASTGEIECSTGQPTTAALSVIIPKCLLCATGPAPAAAAGPGPRNNRHPLYRKAAPRAPRNDSSRPRTGSRRLRWPGNRPGIAGLDGRMVIRQGLACAHSKAPSRASAAAETSRCSWPASRLSKPRASSSVAHLLRNSPSKAMTLSPPRTSCPGWRRETVSAFCSARL